jgi:ArsR family transcriptional regulator
MNPAVVDQLSVLSDAIRVRMLAVLEGRELTVSELCDVVQLPQSTVSRHLKTLLDGEWVASRRDGTRRLYTLPLADVDPSAKRLWQVVREQVTASTAAASDDVAPAEANLERRRPSPKHSSLRQQAKWDSDSRRAFDQPVTCERSRAARLRKNVVRRSGCGNRSVAQLARAVQQAHHCPWRFLEEMLPRARERLSVKSPTSKCVKVSAGENLPH